MNYGTVFQCTALAGTNKTGLIPQLDNGYYLVVLGALNIYNSAGEYYAAEQARKVFDESGDFQRKIRSGALYAENGHPVYEVGMSDVQYKTRLLEIRESRICAHIRRVYLDDKNIVDRNGNKIVAILGEVRPDGELGYVLENALKNKDRNLAFSIRSFTAIDYSHNGRRTKHIKLVTTFDFVGEPGIHVADKYWSPALENYGADKQIMLADDLWQGSGSRATVDQINAAMMQQQRAGIANESSIKDVNGIYSSMGWSRKSGSSILTRW